MHRFLILTSALCVMGCATSVDPRRDARSGSDMDGAILEHSSGPGDVFDLLTVRVGVEYVAPADSLGAAGMTFSTADSRSAGRSLPRPTFRADPHEPPRDDAVTVVALRAVVPPGAEETTPTSFGDVWTLGEEEIDRVEDPYEQAVLFLVDDLIGEDRRRLQREFGAPMILTRSTSARPRALRNAFDERLEEEEAEFNDRAISSLIRRPLRHALRKLPFVANLEAEYEDFKSDNVPVTSGYQDQHGGMKWGRVSGRLRLHDSFDPVEVSYLNYGCRIGTSQHYLRLEYDLRLAENVFAGVGLRQGYDRQTPDTWNAAFHWRFDADNYLHVSAGHNLSFLGGPTEYANVDSRMDGTRGILFFVEHLF